MEEDRNKNKWPLLSLNITILALLVLYGVFFFVQRYPIAFGVKTDVLIPADKIGLKDEITVQFSFPMIPESVTKSFSIYPEQAVVMKWGEKNKSVTISPGGHWQMDTDYKIELAGAQSVMFTRLEDQNINFSTIEYPKVVDFYPENEAKDIILDIEDPIKVVFDRDISDFDVKFKIKPEGKFVWQLDDSKKIVEIVPVDSVVQGEEYNISVSVYHKLDRPVVENEESIVQLGEKSSSEVYKSAFFTKPPPPEDWSKDLTERVAQAKRFTQPKIKEGKYIDISLASQILSIFENGKIVDAFVVSSGKLGMDTPQGTFQIYNKHPRPWSKAYGLFMPFWMAFTPSGSHGLHELPEWPGGYKEGENHLGIPVSHGCVRLGVGSAEKVYNWAEIGTPVVIYK